ncbi:MAG: Hsp70 family protein [Holosporales bacterium]|jgi:molecular chaperone HscA|nr:Hsp70 family protein [Holosporales bacterium]
MNLVSIESCASKGSPRKCIGIDLGTTNSVVAIADQQSAKILKLGTNNLIPSVLTEDLALENEISKGIYYDFKRFMETPDELNFRGKSALELSTALLKNIRKQIDNVLGAQDANVVITVPARFSDVARKATKIAAQQAGLNVVRLLNEPTAAALAYGLNVRYPHDVAAAKSVGKSAEDGLYVVYDFGGGTFDVTVLRLEGDVFQVLGTTGELNLGGNNIDRDISEALYQSGESLENLQHARFRKEQYNDKLWGKENLNETLASTIEDSIHKHVQQTLHIMDKVLSDLQISKDEILGVILVGGSTRLKYVVDCLKEAFGANRVFHEIDPDCAVALGAALHCETLMGHEMASRPLLLDIVPASLGIETLMGYVENIIPKYTPTPIHVNMLFSTMYDNQTDVLIHIIQGEEMLATNCVSLGQFILKGIRPMSKGEPQIQLNFGVDEDGVLTVKASELLSDVQQSLVIEPYAARRNSNAPRLENTLAQGHPSQCNMGE